MRSSIEPDPDEATARRTAPPPPPAVLVSLSPEPQETTPQTVVLDAVLHADRERYLCHRSNAVTASATSGDGSSRQQRMAPRKRR
jgi:hypothetical protein